MYRKAFGAQMLFQNFQVCKSLETSTCTDATKIGMHDAIHVNLLFENELLCDYLQNLDASMGSFLCFDMEKNFV